MPRLAIQPLLDDLTRTTDAHLATARARFLPLSAEVLLQRPAPESWSAAECFDHLVRTNVHYLHHIEHALASAPPAPETYRTGFVGHRMAESMRPEQIDRKVKTFLQLVPDRAKLDAAAAIYAYIDGARRLQDLLERGRRADLGRVRIPSLLPLIRLRLGDALRLIVYHDGRHLLQAERAIQAALHARA